MKATMLDVRPVFDRSLGGIYVIALVYEDGTRSDVEIVLPSELDARLAVICEVTGIPRGTDSIAWQVSV
jgi:hypothetical protein